MSKTSDLDRPTILVLEGLSGASEAVEEAGGEAWSIYPSKAYADRVKKAFDSGLVEGLLLTGGGDVDPRRYGQTASKKVYGVNEDRDTIEYFALGRAYQAGIPIMGICRGSQIMNVHAGGTLWQDVPTRYGAEAACHKSGTLNVRTSRKSRVRKAMGNNVLTIHLHHQSVRRLGLGFKVGAFDPEHGIVEAIESLPGLPWRVGVQFHPEMASYGDEERGLFREFVLEAAKLAKLPEPTVRPPKPVGKYYVSGTGYVSARESAQTFAATHGWDDEWATGTVIGGKSTSVTDANVKYRDGVESVTFEEPPDDEDVYTQEHDLADEVCPLCHTQFDFIEDYFDHLEFVHHIEAGGKAVMFSNPPLAIEGKKLA